MTIVDTTVYKSFVFIVEDGDNEYEVRMTENDISDDWEILDVKNGDVISTDSELGKELIDLCTEQKLMS
jgi:hypothetical protein